MLRQKTERKKEREKHIPDNLSTIMLLIPVLTHPSATYDCTTTAFNLRNVHQHCHEI